MEQFYKYDRDKGCFVSKPNQRIYAAIVNKPIQFISPWGHSQYLKQWDYLVRRSDDDIYGVMRKNFIENYT